MATKTLNTRIISKHAELAKLEASSLILKEGEIVLAKVNVPQPDGTVAPTFVAKIGNNATFASSPWLFAKASDVYSWAKKANLDATDVPTLEISKISGLQDALNGKVATATYTAGIAALEAAIAKAKTDAVSEATGYADNLNKAMDERVDAIEADYLKEADKTELEGKINGVGSRVTTLESQMGSITGEEGIEAKAKAYTDQEVAKATEAAGAAQDAADQAQREVDALEGTVSTLTQTVATNKSAIEGALATETSARQQGDADTLAAAKADAASKDEALHTTISTEIDEDVEAARAALQANIDKKVDKTTYDAKVATLEAADTALDGRLDTVEAKLANVSNVMDFRGAVTAKPAVDDYQNGDVIVVTEGNDAGKEFVLSDGEWVEFGSTSAADSAIAQLQDDVADLESNKADKSTVSALDAAYKAADTTLQGNIDTLSGTVTANKTAFDNYKTSNDTRVKAVEDDITNNVKKDISANATAIDAVEAKVSAIEGDYLKDEDKTELQGKIDDEATARTEADNALGGRIDGVSNKVTAAEGKIQTLEGKVTANEGAISANAGAIAAMDEAYKEADSKLTDDLAALTNRVAANETAIAGNDTDIKNLQDNKADKTTVDGIDTRLASVESKAIFEDDEIILDCGGAE